MPLNLRSTSHPGFPISFRTSSHTCSGAIFICPETCLETRRSRYSSPFLLSATIMSCLMPEFTKTLFTPSISDIERRRSIWAEWSIPSFGQGPSRHLLSSHLPTEVFFLHSMQYMLAVGPPTSWMTPLKPFLDAILSASARMDPLERDTTVVPWWAAMAQKEQFP